MRRGGSNFALAYEASRSRSRGEVSRIFLGVQIQCAQCHDHKTDPLEAGSSSTSCRVLRGRPVASGEQGGKGEAAGLRGRQAGQGTVLDARPEGPAEADTGEPRFFLARGADPVPDGPHRRRETAPWWRPTSPGRTTRGSPRRSSTHLAVLIGEGFTEPDRRHGAGPGGAIPRGARGAGLAVAAGGLRRPVALRTILNTRAYRARHAPPNSRLGADALRGELLPASSAPTRILEALAQDL
jgi:hypothetical protein